MEGIWGIVVVPCPFLWHSTTIGAIRLFFTGDILPIGRASIIVGDRSTRITTDLLYTNIYSVENIRMKVKLKYGRCQLGDHREVRIVQY